MIILGIDPGKSGGISIITDKYVDSYPMPVAGKDIDMSTIAILLSTVKSQREEYESMLCYIEKVHAMPQQGVSSTFNFGFTTGALHGLVAAFGIPRYTVTPQAWKKVVLEGTKKDKQAAIDYCRMAYPDVSLLATKRSRVCHDGMADSLCIATYGRMKHGNSRQ